jgi:hypothetical protein
MIAHGESIELTEERISKASKFILDAMRAFRTDVENCVVEGKFRIKKV